MFFFPYKADITLNRIPILTFLICLICIFVYWGQVSSNNKLIKNAYIFCENLNDVKFSLSLEKVAGDKTIENCAIILSEIHIVNGDKEFINNLAEDADEFSTIGGEEGKLYIASSLSDTYSKFSKSEPRTLTSKLFYEPGSFKLFNMVSSIFAHADIFHLFGNLIFFFAFAATVEIVVGLIKYTALTLLISIVESISYSLSVLGDPNAVPTIGLSGVVMGMIGVFAFLMPNIRIRCLLFFVFILRTILLPAWLLAVVYIGLDIYELNYGDSNTQINLIAHISGAFIGFLFGIIFLRKEKINVRDNLTEIRY